MHDFFFFFFFEENMEIASIQISLVDRLEVQRGIVEEPPPSKLKHLEC